MTENEISKAVLELCIQVHSELGPGLLESVYETILEAELQRKGFTVQRQAPIPVVYNGTKLGDGFRADLVVNGKVIIEIKSVETVPKVAYKILLTYLRLSGCKLGILVNFSEERVVDGFKRVVNNL